MIAAFWLLLTYPLSFFRGRHDLALEVLALRHQLMVLKRQTRKPRIRRCDRCFWLLLMRVWSNRRNPLIILRTETLTGWQRAGFRIDFFVVPTVTFRLLYVLIILHHDRRKVVHLNITDSPSAAWTAQQVVNAFPFDTAPKYLLRDRDSIYGSILEQRVKGMGIEQTQTAPRSPWQNPFAERLIGSIRRECLDRIIVLNEEQLRGILTDCFDYYHRTRPHRSLSHDSPIPRPVELPDRGRILEMPQVGGLHHRYLRQAA